LGIDPHSGRRTVGQAARQHHLQNKSKGTVTGDEFALADLSPLDRDPLTKVVVALTARRITNGAWRLGPRQDLYPRQGKRGPSLMQASEGASGNFGKIISGLVVFLLDVFDIVLTEIAAGCRDSPSGVSRRSAHKWLVLVHSFNMIADRNPRGAAHHHPTLGTTATRASYQSLELGERFRSSLLQ
jgi:hypothetical protein